MKLWLSSLTGSVLLALTACDQPPPFEPVCGTTAADSTKTEVVAVIGDGYGAQDDRLFRANIDGLVCDGLFKDPVYWKHRDRFAVVAARHVSNVSQVTDQQQDTAFKTVFNGSPAQCNFTESEESVALIREAVRGVHGLRSVILLANADGPGGFANGDLIYIANRSTPNIAPHEYGHRAGLYDENVVVEAPYNGNENLERKNCSTECDAKKVWWKAAAEQFPETIGAYPGCLYRKGNICRPSDACRMRAPAEPFSHVCGGLVAEYLEFGNVGLPEAHAPLEATRGSDDFVHGEYQQFVVSTTAADVAPLWSASQQADGFRPQVRPMSDTFYAVIIGDRVVFAESVRTQAKSTSCYPAVDGKPPHEGESRGGTFFVARLPKSALRPSDVDAPHVQLYRLPPNARLPAITADTVGSLVLHGQAPPVTPPVAIPAAR